MRRRERPRKGRKRLLFFHSGFLWMICLRSFADVHLLISDSVSRVKPQSEVMLLWVKKNKKKQQLIFKHKVNIRVWKSTPNSGILTRTTRCRDPDGSLTPLWYDINTLVGFLSFKDRRDRVRSVRVRSSKALRVHRFVFAALASTVCYSQGNNRGGEYLCKVRVYIFLNCSFHEW